MHAWLVPAVAAVDEPADEAPSSAEEGGVSGARGGAGGARGSAMPLSSIEITWVMTVPNLQRAVASVDAPKTSKPKPVTATLEFAASEAVPGTARSSAAAAAAAAAAGVLGVQHGSSPRSAGPARGQIVCSTCGEKRRGEHLHAKSSRRTGAGQNVCSTCS